MWVIIIENTSNPWPCVVFPPQCLRYLFSVPAYRSCLQPGHIPLNYSMTSLIASQLLSSPCSTQPQESFFKVQILSRHSLLTIFSIFPLLFGSSNVAYDFISLKQGSQTLQGHEGTLKEWRKLAQCKVKRRHCGVSGTVSVSGESATP